MSRSLYEQWIEYRRKQERLDELTRGVERASTRGDYQTAVQSMEEVLRLRDELERSPLHVLEPEQPYHTWLPDHRWHADLDWEHLPPFIRSDPVLMGMLLEGEEVNSNNVSYRIGGRRLMRKLHGDRPAISLEPPSEEFHDWLPDHEWHDDLNWEHVPLFIRRNNRLLEMLLRGQDINSAYVSYKIIGRRLMRKLHDDRPAISLDPPREEYHDWLPDHDWHDDLAWRHVPVFILSNPDLLNRLLQGHEVNSRNVTYRIVDRRLMRKLHDDRPAISLKPPCEDSPDQWPDKEWRNYV